MRIKLDKTYTARTEKNNLNRGVFPRGMYQNSIYLTHEGEEYIFYPHFTENSILIPELSQIGDEGRTNKRIPNFSLEIKISRFKIGLLKYLLNRHKLNYRIYGFKKNIYERRKTIYSFGIAAIGGLIYFFINHFNDNILMKLISSNLYVQSVIFCITIISVMKLYRPFAVKKGFSEKDAEKVYEDKKKEEEEQKDAQRRATI